MNSCFGVSNPTAYLLIKVFPVILCHQSKQRQKGPTKWVKAGIIVVWVPSHFDARETLWTLPATNRECVKLWRDHTYSLYPKQIHQVLYSFYIIQSSSYRGIHLPSCTAISTEQWISFVWKVIMIFWWREREKSQICYTWWGLWSRLTPLQSIAKTLIKSLGKQLVLSETPKCSINYRRIAQQKKIKYLLLSSEYTSQLKGSAWSVPFTLVLLCVALLPTGIQTHFCFKWPINSCNPMRAKTLKQKTVRIITSESFFTDWNNAPTMVFRPVRYNIMC